jgi:hypothetical protein
MTGLLLVAGRGGRRDRHVSGGCPGGGGDDLLDGEGEVLFPGPGGPRRCPARRRVGRDDVVDDVGGQERLRQILHERGISFQRTRTWKESTDPDRDAKLDRIEYVTSHFPDRCFAFDQFGPLSIRPVHGSSWALRKRPARLPATYHRTCGIRYFHGCYCLGGDQLWGVMRERKGGDHWPR